MASTNARKRNTFNEVTHGGARAAQMTQVQALRRSVLSCLLWEDSFYESGKTIASRIQALAADVPVSALAEIAIEAREDAKLRHVPLLLLVALAKRGSGSSIVSETIARVIQRADELSEFVALYWKLNPSRADGRKAPLSAQVKLGLAKAFEKFDAYQIAKYDRARDVRLRDVLFLSHAPSKGNDARAALFNDLVNQTLVTPDTWEVALSTGGDKKAEFTRLLEANKLGYMALLRNLRGMNEAGVDEALVRAALLARRGADRVLPFRYLTAAKHAPRYEDVLEEAMFAAISDGPKLAGKTIVIVDNSGSMQAKLSGKSDMTRLDAAHALTAVLREQCERAVVYVTAGDDGARKHATMAVPTARRGFGLISELDIHKTSRKIGGGGIFLKQVIDHVRGVETNADRIVVITDEQDTGRENPRSVEPFGTTANYMVNVASDRNGIGYAKWTHIDGFSEAAVRYMLAVENANLPIAE
jgi:60 kDa SS-A/Ro ribonucleoprotein